MDLPFEQNDRLSSLVQHHNDVMEDQHSGFQRCCYASKPCGNPRVVKRSGQSHRLCEYHRARANQNQRKLELKKKLRSTVQPHVFISAHEWRELFGETSHQCEPPSLLPAYEFDEEDLRVLQALLFDDDDGLSTSF